MREPVGGGGEPGLQADQRMLDKAWVRIGAASVIAAQGMVFTFALNLDESDQLDLPRAVVHGLLLASALGALGFLGGDLLRESVAAVRARRITIDLLFLITLIGALVGSLVSTFRGVGEVYYEVVAILIVVHTVGRMLGARSRMAALKTVERMRQDFSRCRRLGAAGLEERVDYASIQAGDLVRVLPSEVIPVDGVVASGASAVEESAMTGEWGSVRRETGDPVQAGSHALDGELVIRASGGVRQVDLILEHVERAQLAPSEIQAQADRLTAFFLPVVVIVALGTGVAWSLVASWDVALFRAMAVLLVACPCAMGLATPVAIWGALASLGRMGVVARSGDFVDRLAEVDMAFLDKTGTLSSGALEVVDWKLAPGANAVDVEATVASIESNLAHPIARALSSRKASVDKDSLKRTLIPGRGVLAVVNGEEWAIGDRSLGRGAPEEPPAEKWVHVFRAGAWHASIRLAERWREGMAEAVDRLRALGIAVEVVSGDPSAGETLALPATVHAGVAPLAKERLVREARDAGHKVLFVGDGINDAAAMAASHVALAMGGGTDLARAAAAAVHRGDRLDNIPAAVALSRRARKAVRRNLIFSFCYNVAGMALAAAGWLHPVTAALLMVGSSAIVSATALRAVRPDAGA